MGVGCHFLLQCMQVKSESEVAQSCPTFSDPMDCSLPGFSVHGIFQARVLEWGAIAFSSFISYYLLIITKRCSFLDISLWWPNWKLQGNRRLFFIPAFLSGPNTQWKQLWLNVLSHSRLTLYLISVHTAWYWSTFLNLLECVILSSPTRVLHSAEWEGMTVSFAECFLRGRHHSEHLSNSFNSVQ